MGGRRGVRLGRWIKIGWPRLYDGALMGGSFSSRGTIYGVFFFLFEESFIGD